MYDMNDAGPQMTPVGDTIPDGTFAKLRMIVRPGGVNGATPIDAGLLRASKTSDAKMLDCEFTAVDGAFARRKFWQMFTVSGGKLDDKGQSKGWNISKGTFRAMSDSALNVSVPLAQPDDTSVGAPTTKRFSWSWLRPWRSTTLLAGSLPMRQPPPGWSWKLSVAEAITRPLPARAMSAKSSARRCSL